ncbi:hypothetical protein GQ457_09G000200 [Hibiscus cannabinus]
MIGITKPVSKGKKAEKKDRPPSSAIKEELERHRSLSFQAYALFPTMQIASLGEGKEARRIHLDLCSSTHLDCLWVIWYALVRLGGVSENLHASMKHD